MFVTDPEDHQLVLLFKDSSTRNSSFNVIIRKYQQRLYWHIRKMVIDHDDADDILQNTFVKVWENLENFREESKLYSWLYRIATNETLNFLNKKKKRNFFSFHDVENELESKLGNSPGFSGDEIQMKLQRAILKLPEKQRLVFNMKYFDDMKYEDMSEILSTSVGALKASYHHAVKKIEKIIRMDLNQ